MCNSRLTPVSFAATRTKRAVAMARGLRLPLMVVLPVPSTVNWACVTYTGPSKNGLPPLARQRRLADRLDRPGHVIVAAEITNRGRGRGGQIAGGDPFARGEREVVLQAERGAGGDQRAFGRRAEGLVVSGGQGPLVDDGPAAVVIVAGQGHRAGAILHQAQSWGIRSPRTGPVVGWDS